MPLPTFYFQIQTSDDIIAISDETSFYFFFYLGGILLQGEWSSFCLFLPHSHVLLFLIIFYYYFFLSML